MSQKVNKTGRSVFSEFEATKTVSYILWITKFNKLTSNTTLKPFAKGSIWFDYEFQSQNLINHSDLNK